MTAPMTLRPMTESDLSAVLDLDRSSHITPWSDGNFRDALSAGNLCLVGEQGGSIVACAVLQMAAGVAELLTLAVSREARRSGFGREMLSVLVARALEYRAAAIWLEVRESNAAAIELYRDAGFAQTGRRPAYYQRGDDAREDAITMRLYLMTDRAEGTGAP